ncbi:hypothetical protein LJD42_28000, partial [Escherichia coli]|nr:hypothetical protein [Escherichia coli]
REAALLVLRDEVADLRTNRAPATLRATKERHKASRIKGPDWAPFLLDYEGDVDALITAEVASARSGAAGWRGKPVAVPADMTVPLIAADADLSKQTQALLDAEVARLTKLVALDTDTQKRFTALTQKIAAENIELGKLSDRLADYQA